jgi:hypothetical protein
MNTLLFVLLVLILALLVWWWLRRSRANTIEASDGVADLKPTAVSLPEESGPQERGRRTGETQELRRNLAHGPFRPIDERGAASGVQSDARSDRPR